MSQPSEGQSLSWGDTFFLFLEREGQPLNIAGVSEFEGVLPLQGCIDFVVSKLPRIPRYTQHVVFPPFNVGLPSWEPDPRFDIRNHVRLVKVKNGTDADLKALAGRLVSERMDREHPLWDLTLVHGLKGNRTGVIARLHHSLADGISGVGLMNVLMDSSPTAYKSVSRKQHEEEAPKRDAGALLLDRLLKSYLSVMQGAWTAQSEVLTLAQEILATANNGLMTDLIQLVPELGTPSERLPFNKVCRGPQHVAWADIPMVDIKAVRAICGGTVNDVILTVVATAFRRYAQIHGVNLKGRQLRTVVPVNLRGAGDVGGLGNQITFLPINLPLDVADPRKLLATVGERMQFLRSAGVAEFVGLAGNVISRIPLPMQAILAPIASQLPLSVCNTICTNVPGPQFPLYLMGHKMLRWYPYVPIGGEMGINTAVLSYNGVAYVGFSGDVHAAPDLEKLEGFVRASFADLLHAAGVKSDAKIKNSAPQVKSKAKPQTKPSPLAAKPRKKTKAPLKGAKRTVTKKTPKVATQPAGETGKDRISASPPVAVTREPEPITTVAPEEELAGIGA